MSIVYVAPYIPPPPPPEPWQRTRHMLSGVSGHVWDISDPSGGVFLTRDGIRGMEPPAWTVHRSTSPVVHGARYHGRVAPERAAMLPLYLYDDASSAGWTDLFRTFMSNMDPDYPVQWTVQHPDSGQARSLQMRFEDPGDWAETQDSRWRGWRRMSLNFIADERPFWEGQTVVETWTQAEPVDFFDGDGAPPFRLSQAVTMGGATVTNPGDEPVWPIWEIIGEPGAVSSVTVGVNGRFVDAPISVPMGSTLRIDTRPGRKSAYLDGVRVTPDLGRRQWEPIPRGGSVPLSLEMVGEGKVRCSFTPLYHGAH